MKDELERNDSDVLVMEEVAPEEKHERRTATKTSSKPKMAPNYHVIIWNDEEHSYEYVIELLMKLFGHGFEKAYRITHEVDRVGKGIAHTCHQELAELKRDQILGYGADWRMKNSHGSIRATIEPVPE